MCGIFGFTGLGEAKNLETLANDFAKSLNHRGPDDFGYKLAGGSCIGNTRLSIIDIAAGHQPIHNETQDVFVVQNGEIYNFIEIREDLKRLGRKFNTNSDTEVILVAYLEWGEAFVSRLNGMFAIAILDLRTRRVLLFRDRLGVKPLYLYQRDKEIFFASEIKAFYSIPGFMPVVNKQAVVEYLHFNYVPLPQTIFQGIRHLSPGNSLIYSLDKSKIIDESAYWDYAEFFKNENRDTTEEDVLLFLDNTLKDAVNIRMRSDVEVGAFLSGGLDSSLVCAYMRNESGSDLNIPVFSIGFNELRFDESKYSAYVADKYNLSYNLRKLQSDILSYWRRTTYYNDQPHGDTSFVPTYLVSQFAAETNKVVLTGDGGDELLAGYDKYKLITEFGLDKYFEKTSVFSIQKLNEILTGKFKKDVDLNGCLKKVEGTLSKVPNADDINKALYFDVVQLLPGNNLVKPDKMAMANSLETRSPFLDYRFFEYFAAFSGDDKLKDGETKYFAKKLALMHFDDNHVYRNKQMFTVPAGEWFKDALRGYVQDILFDGRLEERGIFNIEMLKLMVEEHNSERKNFTREIRAVLNLEIWFRIFIDNENIDD